MPLPIADAFADLPDPRVDRNKLHLLADILVVALCAVISGAETWEQIAEYGRRKEAFFRRFLALPHGVPSHDTFYRVFIALDPDRFADAFGRWMAAACDGTGLVPIAVDGKSARRSKKGTFSGCLHLVSAWAAENHLVLGQRSVADGSHEIAAVPELLRVLDLTGAVVTLDAAGCQTENAALIREGGGHYVLAVKGNQPGLSEAVAGAFGRACEADFAGVRYDQHESVEDGHGRHEERYVTVIYDPPGLPADWPDAAAVVQVNRERVANGARETTTHYYVTSHPGTAAELAGYVRGHWGIENGLHWVLDVAFREDESRTRAGHAGANLGMLRRVAVSLLKRAGDHGSIQTRRLMAAWDDDYLFTVLQGIAAD
jgi:predicted transposase YbfD/YdcC